jgi:hypothetical protein
MVDLSQSMRWEYREGPAIGSYTGTPHLHTLYVLAYPSLLYPSANTHFVNENLVRAFERNLVLQRVGVVGCDRFRARVQGCDASVDGCTVAPTRIRVVAF